MLDFFHQRNHSMPTKPTFDWFQMSVWFLAIIYVPIHSLSTCKLKEPIALSISREEAKVQPISSNRYLWSDFENVASIASLHGYVLLWNHPGETIKLTRHPIDEKFTSFPGNQTYWSKQCGIIDVHSKQDQDAVDNACHSIDIHIVAPKTKENKHRKEKPTSE